VPAPCSRGLARPDRVVGGAGRLDRLPTSRYPLIEEMRTGPRSSPRGSWAGLLGLVAGLTVAVFSEAAWAEGACRWSGAAQHGGGAFGEALAKGPAYAGLAAGLSGVLVSLTPCVYPMIAVTVSIFGARQARGRWQGTALSAVFVAGIVAMFVPLGVVAGLTGSMFGAWLQNRWVILGVSAFFVAMASSLFGAFELTLPASLQNRLSEVGGSGYRGAFLLGLVCGLVATPCTGPWLTGMVTWIAQTGSAGYGALAMLAFALGLGLPFFLVGTFAIHLPKSGRWMVHVKSALGLVMLVVALYFAGTVLPWLTRWASPQPGFLVGAALAVLLGLVLGAVHRSFHDPGVGPRLAKAAGILLVTLGTQQLIAGALKPTRSLAWEEGDLRALRERARAEGRPTLVDFTASWCVACKELERHTFSEPSVTREAQRFLAVRIDLTEDTPANEALKQAQNLVGLPTVIAFDSKGLEAVRCTDFVPAGEFLETLKKVH
jgi:thiol:disulfide interchange protein DsbD